MCNARGLSYLVEAVDKHNGEKMPEFKSKKDHAYEDWQIKEYCKIEIKVNGEILEWVPKYVYLGSSISGDGRHVGGNKEKACYGNKRAVDVEILVEWSRSSSMTKNL